MCCERGGYKASNCCHCRIYIYFNLLGIGMTFLFETKKKRKTRNVRARFERDKKKKPALGDWVVRWQASAGQTLLPPFHTGPT